ncbi:MAG: Crp/Fnr family transcriptional regulator [Bacilli bacterium]|nr:Crp/Fnr family transcriptional regulator [Bacilli bacterium]
MNDLFYNISDDEKEKILRNLEANTFNFQKNKTILSSVKQENIIGVLVSGYLQIIKNDYNGNKVIIDDLYDNSIFGTTMSSISSSEYSIVTKEDSKIIIIYFDEIIKANFVEQSYMQFIKNLLNIMSNKINANNVRIEILSNKTTRNKLLSYFKIMSKKNKSNILYLPYTFTDLADYLSVDRTSMHRELKNLKEEGLIEIKNKRITLNLYDDNDFE